MREQADLTLAELQQRLGAKQKVQLSVARLWWALKDLGLRLKKSHSTPANARRPEAQRRQQAWWEEIQSLNQFC